MVSIESPVRTRSFLSQNRGAKDLSVVSIESPVRTRSFLSQNRGAKDLSVVSIESPVRTRSLLSQNRGAKDLYVVSRVRRSEHFCAQDPRQRWQADVSCGQRSLSGHYCASHGLNSVPARLPRSPAEAVFTSDLSGRD